MSPTLPPVRANVVAKFRLRRHHLLPERPADAVTLCRDICGAQAQVMTAAYLQLWTRNHALTRSLIENELWKTRALVKTSLMRQTLHIIPTDEFPIYIAALKPTRIAQALSVMARCGISPEEGHAITPMILEALSAGPLRRPDIAAAVRPKVSKRVRFWMENSWSMIRIPVAEGNICYGRGEGSEIVFIRAEQWLPTASRKSIPVQEAQCELLRKYLRSYGPATIGDFAHWAGISMAEVRQLPALLDGELVEIPGEKKGSMLLREDLTAFKKKSSAKEASIRLLPLFDPYLLAHREKDHLLSTQHYKRVYRNQGWISPVVLVEGAIAGVWSHKLKNKNLVVEVETFEKASKPTKVAIEREADSLARYFESSLSLKFA